MHTREIAAYGGLVHRMPVYATIFLFFTMGNVGLPGTSGFVGEFLTLTATFQVNTWAALFATTGVILSAGYALWLYKRVTFGAMTNPALKAIADVDRREVAIFAPLVAGTLILGVYPSLLTDLFAPATAALVEGVRQDVAAWRDGVALALK
jgi:NADH-quinone oxidoreductase subunit M